MSPIPFSAPPEISDYNVRELCADIDGLAKALGHDEFTVIGHDWGCLVAWNTALLHPDTCKAVMGLSVPFWRFGPESVNPPGMDDQFWYIRYFQKPGVAEAEFEADLERTLRTFYVGASGDADGNFMDQLKFPKTTPMLEILPPPPEELPSWLSRADLDYYLEEYRASGFRGPINWYRNIPTNNALTPELDGARFTQPAAFAAGTADPVLLFDPNWRERFEAAFDDLRFLEMIEGAGHWVQQEKAEETTASMLRFLQGL